MGRNFPFSFVGWARFFAHAERSVNTWAKKRAHPTVTTKEVDFYLCSSVEKILVMFFEDKGSKMLGQDYFLNVRSVQILLRSALLPNVACVVNWSIETELLTYFFKCNFGSIRS